MCGTDALNRLSKCMWATLVIVAILFAVASSSPQQSANIAMIERDLEIVRPGSAPTPGLDLARALQVLNIPSVSVALIDRGELAWTRA